MKFYRMAKLVVLIVTVIGGCQSKSPESEGPGGEGGSGGAGDSDTTGGRGGTQAGGKGADGGGKAGGASVAGSGGGTNTGGSTSTGGIQGAAGSMGGAAGALGGSGGANLQSCGAASVCDDFEAYVTGGGFGPWKQNGSNGTVGPDKAHAFSGQQSLKISSPPGANQRTQLQRTGAPLFPTANNVFWGRMMVWANKLPGKSDKEDKNVHYDIVQATGSTPGEYRIAGMGGVLLNYEPHDCYFGTSKVIPEDKWTCWEWLFDGGKNTIEFYIDSQLQARVVGKGQGCVDNTDSVWAAPAAFNLLRVGFVNYQSKAETTTLWIDDFAGGATRHGCPVSSSATH